MKFSQMEIPGIWMIEPHKFGDTRGYFVETFKEGLIEKHIGSIHFIQDNESKSSYGVLRGLHFQKGEYAQAKLVRAIVGRVLDVAVDIRPDSATFGKHVALELSDENLIQMFVPRGFAHGFIVLSEFAILGYKVDNFYAPHTEGCLLANDPALGINWQLREDNWLMSDKDKQGMLLKDLKL